MKKQEDSFLKFLYGNFFGRVILKLLSARFVSKIAGAYLDSPVSKPLIKKFVKKNGIDLNDFEADNFRCFNDCFTRKIKDGKRIISYEKEDFISPCDALLSAYKIGENTDVCIKNREYTVKELLKNEELAEFYKDGTMIVFRLAVTHYHRYIYTDNGVKGKNIFIKGVLHTVRPVALKARPVFKENCREYTVIETENFGTLVQMEVGAMLVGKIKNYHEEKRISRGEEKGMFLYGGSTIILFIPKGKAEFPKEYFEKTERGEEIPVQMGQTIGKKM